MPDIEMCANATPHCGKTFDCYRHTDSGTKPSWQQAWGSQEGGKECRDFLPKRSRLNLTDGGGRG